METGLDWTGLGWLWLWLCAFMQPKCWFAACFFCSLLLQHPSCVFMALRPAALWMFVFGSGRLLRSLFVSLLRRRRGNIHISLSFILPGVMLFTARGRPAFKIETKGNEISRCAVAWDLRLALVQRRVPALKEWNRGGISKANGISIRYIGI